MYLTMEVGYLFQFPEIGSFLEKQNKLEPIRPSRKTSDGQMMGNFSWHQDYF